MKNKEINLSSASLNEKFEKKVLKEDSETVKEVKEVKSGKLTMLGAKFKELIARFSAWWKVAPMYKKILVVTIPALLILGGSAFFFFYVIYGPKKNTTQTI